MTTSCPNALREALRAHLGLALLRHAAGHAGLLAALRDLDRDDGLNAVIDANRAVGELQSLLMEAQTLAGRLSALRFDRALA